MDKKCFNFQKISTFAGRKPAKPQTYGPRSGYPSKRNCNCTKQINIMMKKKEYQTPVTEVIMLEQQAQLLAGSGNSEISIERSDYGDPITGQDWE